MTKWDVSQACNADLTLEKQCNPSHQQAKREKSHEYQQMQKKHFIKSNTVHSKNSQ